MILIIIIFVWWMATYFNWVSPLMLSSPLDVLSSLYHHGALFTYHTLISITPLVIGILMALTFGILQATIVHKNGQKGHGLSRLIHIFQGVPSFIVMPILVIWLGHNMLSKAVMVGLWSFFSIYASLLGGYQTLPNEYVNLSKTYHITAWQRIRHIDFYHALPSLMAGVKIALTHAPLTVLAAEWFGAHSGLGYLLMLYYAQLDMPMVFALVVVIICLVMALNFIWKKLYEKIIYWL